MKQVYKSRIKTYIRSQFIQARDELNLTQAKMARKLLMEDRSYAAIESGESCCGTLTLVLFLVFCCKDQTACLNGLREALENVEQDMVH